MPHLTTPLVTPLDHSSGLGARVTNISLRSLTPEQFSTIEDALYRYKVLVFPEQMGLEPDEQFEFVRMFDPEAPAEHGHQDATASHKGQKSLLYGIGNSISKHPEVKLVGGGPQGPRFNNVVLAQADHTSYHKFPLTEEQREKGLLTRWHRWHMDASLYRTSLPLVTCLLAHKVPQGPPLTVTWDDGSNLTMPCAAGSTGFISGARMFELLSPSNKELARNSKVVYAPHPYQWGGANKGNSNGLGTYSQGLEMEIEDLPEWKEEDVKVYPMVWTNPKTGEESFQVHSVGVHKILLKTSADAEVVVVDDLLEVRKILYDLQISAVTPENILLPAYTEGDLVLFYNRGVYHSATDYPPSFGTRTMLQAHVAGSSDPK